MFVKTGNASLLFCGGILVDLFSFFHSLLLFIVAFIYSSFVIIYY